MTLSTKLATTSLRPAATDERLDVTAATGSVPIVVGSAFPFVTAAHAAAGVWVAGRVLSPNEFYRTAHRMAAEQVRADADRTAAQAARADVFRRVMNPTQN